VVLSRIIVDNPDVAEELREQIETGDSFEQMAREHSLTEERLANGMMGAISIGTLPEPLLSEVIKAEAGTILGPLQVEGRWGLFRVEQFLPSSLEDFQVRQALQNELFERWLGERLQKLNVKLQVS
jgi:parvulin-like peptidyl-prolyl isomerase